MGHDPYAGADEGSGGATLPEVGEINSSAKGLFRLAQLTGNSSTLAPGACKKCGQVGHLYFQCRNNMSIRGAQPKNEQMLEEEDDDDPDSQDFPSSDEDDDSDSSGDDGDDSDDSSSSEDSSE